MKKNCLLPATRRSHLIRPVKVKMVIATLLFAVYFSPLAFSQQNCDTLVAKDGRRIAVQIIRSSSTGYLYTKCSETTGQQYFMNKEKILEIRKTGLVKAPIIEPPPPPTPPKEKQANRPTVEQDPSKPKIIVWAGLSPLGLASFQYETNGSGYFLFGAEKGFKDSPLRLGVILRPISSNRNSYYTSYQNNGIKGEIGLVLKVFTQGRLSGTVSKGYWGFDLRSGREAYTYSTNSLPNQQTNMVKYTWTSFMPRFGYQFYYHVFAFDVALPIGYQALHYTETGSFTSQYTGGNLTLQPCASIGFRF